MLQQSVPGGVANVARERKGSNRRQDDEGGRRRTMAEGGGGCAWSLSGRGCIRPIARRSAACAVRSPPIASARDGEIRSAGGRRGRQPVHGDQLEAAARV